MTAALAQNEYPGRGLVAAACADGTSCIAYFMTGRSEASRDRVLTREGNTLRAHPPFDTAFDPLRHYRAAVVQADWCIVGNGDQVDEIAGRLTHSTPEHAVQGIEYEPDPPLRTPRITAIASRGNGAIVVTGARASLLDPDRTIVSTLSLGVLSAGCGVLTTTYLSEGRTVTATNQLPAEVAVEARTPAELRDRIWAALHPQLRVSIAVVVPQHPDPLSVDTVAAHRHDQQAQSLGPHSSND